MKHFRRRALALVSLSASLLVPAALRGQDSLHVLRLQPASPAAPNAPVVVLFDHPIAPRLDASLEASRVLGIIPTVGARIYWRDPSTIVAEFDSAWASGASYVVTIDPGLRSERGLPLATTPPMRVQVEMPRALVVRADAHEAPTDTVLHAVAVYSTGFNPGALTGHAWLVPRPGCDIGDSIPLTVSKIRSLAKDDSYELTEAGRYNRDRRLDSLRRVVELSTPRILPRGCVADLHLPLVIGERAIVRLAVAVRPPFQQLEVRCGSGKCERGPIILRFSNEVSPEQVRANVRVDGRPARVAGDRPETAIALLDSVQSRHSVHVTISGDLRNVSGERLRRDTSVTLTGDPMSAKLGFASGLQTIPRDAATLLRVRHINTDSVLVVIGRVPDSARAVLLEYGDGVAWKDVVRDSVMHAVATPTPDDIEGIADITASVIPSAWRDDPLLVVRLAPVPRSLLAWSYEYAMPPIVVRGAPPDGRRLRYAVVRRSGIAAHAVVSEDLVDVWVTSLRDAHVRSGARVRVVDDSGRVLATAMTDSRGRARMTVVPSDKVTMSSRLLEVSDGNERTVLNLPMQTRRSYASVDEDSTAGNWRYGNASQIGDMWLHGTAFTERAIYRPGERVYLSGAIRTFTAARGYATPAADSARWTVWRFDPEYARERVWSHVGRLSEFGTLADSTLLSTTAQLGYYSASLALRSAGTWRVVAETWFNVAEYRAPEFAVHLDRDTTAMLFTGDTAHLRLDGRYLFGLPLARGSVKWWSELRKQEQWELRVRGLEKFSVGRSGWHPEDSALGSKRTDDGDGVLGDDGVLRLDVPAMTSAGPSVLVVNASVADANRQTVTTEISIPVHAANAYVGMRTRDQRWVWRAKDSVAVEMLVVHPDGTPRVGDTIAMFVERTRWVASTLLRDTVWRTTLRSASTPVSATFVPGEGGSFELFAVVTDERGRRAVSSLDIWVAGDNAWWARGDPRAITMRSDRTRYAPGEVASVIVESTAEQRAWVTLSREGILSEQFVSLHSGINELRVAIPLTAAPGATIHLRAVRPFGSGAGDDSAGVYFRSGSLGIEVDTTLRALRVAVTPERTRYQPRDTVRLRIDVRDVSGKGHRSEATVWAVDEGVRSLTDYVRPALLSMLLAPGADNPWSNSTLLAWMMAIPPTVAPLFVNSGYVSLRGATVIRLRGMSSLQLSANVVTATGSASAQVRTAFATTPFFAAHVRTDAAGHATTTFVLPDNIGAFRIYAAAIGQDVFAGSGDTSIITTRALVVRPALPRVVRVGDELFAGAVLTQEGAGRAPVSLSVEAKGADVVGPTSLRDTLDGQHTRELRFPMRVTGGDSVIFTFRGATPSASDAVEARLAMSPPGRARAHVVTGMLERADVASLVMPEGTDTVRSHVTLQLGASPLPLVRQFSEALRIYPYNCTEQVSSAGRALLARLSLERAIGDHAELSHRDRTQLELAVSTLLNRQRDDGGFGYWSASNWTTAWLTAYALDFLLGAQRAGIDVSNAALRRAQSYLSATKATRPRLHTEPWIAWQDSIEWPHNALAAATLLRRIGAQDTLLETKLWALKEYLNFEDRVSLALLAAESADTLRATELLDAAWRSAHLEGRRVVLDDSAASQHWLFRSTSRPLALLLTVTAQLQPHHPLLGALFESLVQTGRSESTRWWNTLDQAAVAEALTAASAAMSITSERQIAVSGEHGAIATVALNKGHADSLALPIASLSVRGRDTTRLKVSLTSSTSAPTYYAMTLFEIPLARPVRADDAGIGVERWYESYEGGKPITEVREGELIRVRLRITAPADREFVVIDDALPAGLEAVDLSLRTSASLPPFAGAPRLGADLNEGPPGQRWLYGSWDSGWWTPWEHKEIRDDRVLYFARQLWKGSYQASYVARATTAGTFVRPPAQAEEMYNPAVRGRSDGGTFTITRAP
ncbi:MAG: alpha-2-macroglobulin family protein [bacterium]